MENDALLPSEIARLVLGYLKESGCRKSYQMFLQESQHLVEYKTMLNRGSIFPTTIGGRSLTDILQEDGHHNTDCLRKQAQSTLLNQMENLVHEFKHHSSTSALHSIPNNIHNTTSRITAGDDSDAETLNDTDLYELDTSPTASASFCRNTSRAAIIKGKRSCHSTDSGISSQPSGLATSSIIDETPSGNMIDHSTPCSTSNMDKQIRHPPANASPLEIFINSQKCETIPKKRGRPPKVNKVQTVVQRTIEGITIPSSFVKTTIAGIENKNTFVFKIPGTNIPQVIQSIKNLNVGPGSSSPSPVVQLNQSMVTAERSKNNALGLTSSSQVCVPPKVQASTTNELDQLTAHLPDFDELDDSEFTQHPQQNHQGTGLIPVRNSATPASVVNPVASNTSHSTKVLVSPVKEGGQVLSPVPGSNTADNLFRTPVKKFVSEEVKERMKNNSPRRKSQAPKRRSTGNEFPTKPLQRVSPASGAGDHPANSNDSFMSTGSQGFVPLIEELLCNSKLPEKLAEKINRANIRSQETTQKESQPSKNDISKDDAVNKLATKSHSSEDETNSQIIEGDKVHPGSVHVTERKGSVDRMTSEEYERLFMEDDTVNHIIDMTRNDPEFDVLFNMFGVDKNTFIEKEYGVPAVAEIKSSEATPITFNNILHIPESGVPLTFTNPSGLPLSASDCEPVKSIIHTSTPDHRSTTHRLIQDTITQTGDRLPEPPQLNTIVQPDLPLIPISSVGDATNTTASEGSFVQILIESEDGKSNHFETVQVITVPDQIDSAGQNENPPVLSETETKEAVQTLAADEKNLTAEASASGTKKATVVDEDQSINKTGTPATPDSNISELMTKMGETVVPALSPLLLSQVLMMNMLMKTASSEESLQPVSPLKQSLSQLQNLLGADASDLSLKALEQLNQILVDSKSKGTSGQQKLEEINSDQAASSCDERGLKVGYSDESRVFDSSLVKKKKSPHRKRPNSSDSVSPKDRPASLGLSQPKTYRKRKQPDSPEENTNKDFIEDEEEEERKVTKKSKKVGLDQIGKTVKPRKKEPWKQNLSDKRKFLGLPGKNSPKQLSETQSTESASLLAVGMEEQNKNVLPAQCKLQTKNVTTLTKKGKSSKSSTLKSSLKKSNASTPVVEQTVNTLPVGDQVLSSTVDTSLLSLSVDNKLETQAKNFLMMSPRVDQVFTQYKNTPLPPSTKSGTRHVRTLSFVDSNSGESQDLKFKQTASPMIEKHVKRVSFSREALVNYEDSSQDSQQSSGNLSMPENFNLVFNSEKNDKGQLSNKNLSSGKSLKSPGSSSKTSENKSKSQAAAKKPQSPKLKTASGKVSKLKNNNKKSSENDKSSPRMTTRSQSALTKTENTSPDVPNELVTESIVHAADTISKERSDETEVAEALAALATQEVIAHREDEGIKHTIEIKDNSEDVNIQLPKKADVINYDGQSNDISISKHMENNRIQELQPLVNVSNQTESSRIPELQPFINVSNQMENKIPELQPSVDVPNQMENKIPELQPSVDVLNQTESNQIPELQPSVNVLNQTESGQIQELGPSITVSNQTEVLCDGKIANTLNDSLRSVVSNTTDIIGSPPGDMTSVMRVASKPKAMQFWCSDETRDVDGESTRSSLCQNTEIPSSDSSVPQLEKQTLSQSEKSESFMKQGENEKESENHGDTGGERSKNNSVVDCSDSHLLTPTRKVNIPSPSKLLCSPNRTSFLSKLVEQGMKNFSMVSAKQNLKHLSKTEVPISHDKSVKTKPRRIVPKYIGAALTEIIKTDTKPAQNYLASPLDNQSGQSFDQKYNSTNYDIIDPRLNGSSKQTENTPVITKKTKPTPKRSIEGEQKQSISGKPKKVKKSLNTGNSPAALMMNLEKANIERLLSKIHK